MTNMKILDYRYKAYDTGIALEDVSHIDVSVISGDELILGFTKDGNPIDIDAAIIAKNPRLMDYYDGSYSVPSQLLGKWNERKDTYEWFDKKHQDTIEEFEEDESGS